MKEKKSVRKPKEGDWVILINDKIVEFDADLSKILEIAKQYDYDVITISKIPSAEYCFY